MGLLLKAGKATDTVLPPGLHWVPRLRKRLVAPYPALELAYRGTLDASKSDDTGALDRAGPALRVTLGDRTQATIGYTVRFQLDITHLRSVHERFGPDGFWIAVRDVTARALRHRMGDSDIGVDDLFGDRRNAVEEQIGSAVAAALQNDGMVVTMFMLGDVDLGRTGDVIQSTARARLELEREQAEAQVRVARARIDAELQPYLATLSDAALRYREVDVWRDLAYSQQERALLSTARPAAARATESADSSVGSEPAEEAADEA